MLYFYATLGCLVLIFIIIVTNRYLKRENRYKIKLKYNLQHENYGAAIDFAKKLISLNIKKAEYHLTLADTYLKAKMVPLAIEIYKNMLKNNTYSPNIREHNIREKIAEVNLEQGKIKEAFKELYTISKLKPNSPDAIGLLGKIYGSQQKYDKAKQLLKKAISLDSKEAEFHYQLGLTFLDTGDLGNAVQSLDKAYQLNPQHLKAQYFLALGCRQKGLSEKAKMLFDKLNLKDLSDLPENITNIGIMTQNVPHFDIQTMEKKLNGEVEELKIKSSSIYSIEELINSGTELFHNKAMEIVRKMGYIIQKEVKNRLIDNSIEIDFIVISKRNKDKAEAKKIFIQFTKSKGEIGTIPFADFLSKMHEAKVNSGIFIITSEFSEQIYKRIEKEKENIQFIDTNKLRRFL